jgi:MSHA type pilus biogenesis protein MshL
MLVRTSPRKLKAISEFLLELKKKMQRQVIIDAQILEVYLNDSFRFGIDWQYLGSRIVRGTEIQFGLGVKGQIGDQYNPIQQKPLTAITIQPPNYNENSPLDTTNNVWTGIIDALQTFGTVKIVSNPHVRARHGQPAMFTSGLSKKYISKVTREKDDSGEETFTPETSAVFSGILLGVIPFINNKQEANLQIFPIKSTLLKMDPKQVGDIEMSLPEIEIKNVSTNVKVHNNDIVILGGLIDKQIDKKDSEVPGLGRIPLLGWLFKGKNDTEIVRELVIIMRIKII